MAQVSGEHDPSPRTAREGRSMSEPVDLLTDTLFHYNPGEFAGRFRFLEDEVNRPHYTEAANGDCSAELGISVPAKSRREHSSFSISEGVPTTPMRGAKPLRRDMFAPGSGKRGSDSHTGRTSASEVPYSPTLSPVPNGSTPTFSTPVRGSQDHGYLAGAYASEPPDVDHPYGTSRMSGNFETVFSPPGRDMFATPGIDHVVPPTPVTPIMRGTTFPGDFGGRVSSLSPRSSGSSVAADARGNVEYHDYYEQETPLTPHDQGYARAPPPHRKGPGGPSWMRGYSRGAMHPAKQMRVPPPKYSPEMQLGEIAPQHWPMPEIGAYPFPPPYPILAEAPAAFQNTYIAAMTAAAATAAAYGAAPFSRVHPPFDPSFSPRLQRDGRRGGGRGGPRGYASKGRHGYHPGLPPADPEALDVALGQLSIADMPHYYHAMYAHGYPTPPYIHGMVPPVVVPPVSADKRQGGGRTHTTPRQELQRPSTAKGNRSARLGASPSKPAAHPIPAILKNGTAPLEAVQGQIREMCKDQHGCRYLQRKLEEDPTSCDVIFAEVIEDIVSLMSDPFGNYLCQKLLECCSPAQCTIIVQKVAKDIVPISLSMHGTRAVQKLLDTLAEQQQVEMVKNSLQGNVVTLIKDINGNHVIQRCLQRQSPDNIQFICDAIVSHCVEVATHRHGCCVMQRCIDAANEQQKIQLVAEVTFHALTLVQDPFGNYVVQYVLDLANPRFSDALIRQFLGHVCQLAVQKFSSNVIEKCLRSAEADTRSALLEELCEERALTQLLQDAFGNYVVQTSLSVSEGEQQQKLMASVRAQLHLIAHLPYGKKIIHKLSKEEAKCAAGGGINSTASAVGSGDGNVAAATEA